MDTLRRNSSMAERIGSTPARYPFSFVVAGDSGAWPDPTADGIYSQLLRQVAELDPAPVFFANLGDFAGPGTPDRHEHYLRLVDELPVPNICAVGNHDLDDEGGPDAWARVRARARRRWSSSSAAWRRRMCRIVWCSLTCRRTSAATTSRIPITETGAVSGKVLQAFEPEPGRARLTF